MKNDAKTQENTQKDVKAREYPCDRLKKFIGAYYSASIKAFSEEAGISEDQIRYTLSVRNQKMIPTDTLKKLAKSGININWYITGIGEMCYDPTAKRGAVPPPLPQKPEPKAMRIKFRPEDALLKEVIELLRTTTKFVAQSNQAFERVSERTGVIMTKEYLNKKEASSFIGVCRETLDRMRKDGEIKDYGSGRRIMFKFEDVRRLAEGKKSSRVIN